MGTYPEEKYNRDGFELASKASGDRHANPATSNIGIIGNTPFNKCNKWVPSANYV